MRNATREDQRQDRFAVVSGDTIAYVYGDQKGAESAARNGDRIIHVRWPVTEGDKVGRYWDADKEQYVDFIYRRVHSMAGRVSGSQYRVSYYLAGGGWLNGVRHKDSGDLMTEVKYETRPSVTQR